MRFEVINSELNITRFLEGANAAFKNRSNEKILFEELTRQNFGGLILCALFDAGDEMVAGLTVASNKKNNVNYAHISHVWVHPSKQRMGYGKVLLEYVDEYCLKNDYEFITLGVANIYSPAVRLYQNSGFKAYGVYANVPHTYYFISMRKYLVGQEDDIKRLLDYLISKIKFTILFRKDSTPKLLHRIIFK